MEMRMFPTCNTLGWRALQPPQPGEKKSTTTRLFPAFNNEFMRSIADWISFMLD